MPIILRAWFNTHDVDLFYYNVESQNSWWLYGKPFPFFNHIAPMFPNDWAHSIARGVLGDDIDQYMHENTLQEKLLFVMTSDCRKCVNVFARKTTIYEHLFYIFINI